MRHAALVLGLVIASVAVPATAAEEGRYGPALRRMITETAGGTCPADLMGDDLLKACREQLPAMSAQLSSLGAIDGLTFTRAEERDGGRIELYAVRFAGGQVLNWGIGMEQGGRFGIAYTAP